MRAPSPLTRTRSTAIKHVEEAAEARQLELQSARYLVALTTRVDLSTLSCLGLHPNRLNPSSKL